ncbi:hypothetical protein VNO77_28139 [Canavalia gladiata]|uniref:Uncharacterized protein n=1 Tax=Canavalia gladiata TaxID=3824 RepID=A0AAN9KZ05_CANGL
MARLSYVLFITLVVFVCYSSVLDARKILKNETQVLSLQGTPPSRPSSEGTNCVTCGRLVDDLANEEVVSIPSPGDGHK